MYRWFRTLNLTHALKKLLNTLLDKTHVTGTLASTSALHLGATLSPEITNRKHKNARAARHRPWGRHAMAGEPEPQGRARSVQSQWHAHVGKIKVFATPLTSRKDGESAPSTDLGLPNKFQQLSKFIGFANTTPRVARTNCARLTVTKLIKEKLSI